MEINDITSIIIEECIYIHRELGPGLLESVYEEVLYYRLVKEGFMLRDRKGSLSFLKRSKWKLVSGQI